jgi:hypothetical protein
VPECCGDACTQSIEKVINLCIMRGLNNIGRVRLRAGWTQVDVYRGGDLRKMTTAQHPGRSGQIRSQRCAGEKRSVSGNRLRDLTPICSYCPDGRAERGAWRRCSCPCARIACIDAERMQLTSEVAEGDEEFSTPPNEFFQIQAYLITDFDCWLCYFRRAPPGSVRDFHGRFTDVATSNITYEVIKHLPGDGEYEYRIKSANELHDRVARESELTKA